MSQCRNWCFTLNNYTAEEEAALKAYKCSYLVYGHEVGDEGTPHLQGYIEFVNGKRLSTLKAQLSERIHWERRKGTAKQASQYCKKDRDFYEAGEITKQGKRTDLESVADMMHDKKTLREIAVEHPETFMRYARGITTAWYLTVMTPRKGPPTVIWLWGSTGTGKTRFAFDEHDSVYVKDGTMWWDGYTGQEAIVVDDFDGKWPFRDMLRFLDRYPYQGQIKGGYVYINSPFIYITCEHPPDNIYTEDSHLAQIQRRISHVFHFT